MRAPGGARGWASALHFFVKDGVYGGAALLGLVALPFAHRRWPALLGFLGAFFAFALTPL